MSLRWFRQCRPTSPLTHWPHTVGLSGPPLAKGCIRETASTREAFCHFGIWEIHPHLIMAVSDLAATFFAHHQCGRSFSPLYSFASFFSKDKVRKAHALSTTKAKEWYFVPSVLCSSEDQRNVCTVKAQHHTNFTTQISAEARSNLRTATWSRVFPSPCNLMLLDIIQATMEQIKPGTGCTVWLHVGWMLLSRQNEGTTWQKPHRWKLLAKILWENHEQAN